MSEFTKGKWQATHGGFVKSVGNKTICEVWPCDTFDEAKANARLIAEAPEMYELLKLFAYPEEPCTARTLEVSNKVWKLLRNIDGEETEDE